MEIRKMFYKPIDRDIKGVIKIGQDDDSNVYQELEEYVVTRELLKHFDNFFEAYKKGIHSRTDKMGVWISGFFGSGKSHFLKILSYLLENKAITGRRAVEFFDDKIEDPMILADMQAAGDVSTDVILFNIDSKADSDSKTNKDAIVKVFMKVFNEMQGFCGSLPWVADLERQMVRDGTYEAFKIKFRELSGRAWEDTREDFYFEEDNIVKALAETTKMSEEGARNWYSRAEENYTLSIEKFAGRVKEYIEAKGENHHVVFLVDEIGQYIGDDTRLMLNLQTVVEDLGTQCGGRAWVLVTSQQDIDSVTRVKGNDFSKIQGRFNTRISLSSANVDEVIKQRILLKKDGARDTLKLLYEDKSAILKNLITFSADTAEMKTYRDGQDFADVYPFIPYQFNLLQSVFTAIRLHGASGKHLAEGERSLLSAFQESALLYSDREMRTLVPFSAFYNTIEAFLDHNIRTVIIHAQDNDRLSEEDVEVLKVLFMIKYVKELPANIENLATLMVSHIDEDKIDLKKRIEASLKRLVKETLIQKNGAEYIFLTHEEQDVNKEIQHIQVELGEIIQKISEVIFEDIYPDKKYRYSSRYNFGFNQIIDDRVRGAQNNEIGVKVITPYYSGGELTDQELKMMSARENNLIVKLPMDPTFLEEMEEVLKIQTYLLRKGGTTSTQEIEEIKARKSREATERKERVKTLLTEALKEADLFVYAQKLDIKDKNPVNRLNDGLKTLMESIYTKLNYITQFIDSTKEIFDILMTDAVQTSLTPDDKPNKLALDEVDSFIARNTERNIPVTMKGIIDIYAKAPYGWKEPDITGLVASLFKAQEINLVLGSEYLEIGDKNLINYLSKRDYVDRLLIKKRTRISPALISNARNLAKEVFNHSAVPSDEDGLMHRFKELCRQELYESEDSINRLLAEYAHGKYPGKDILEKGRKIFEEIINIKDSKDFYQRLQELKEDLLDYEEDFAVVKKFFKNQREHFDKAVRQLNIYEKNKSYVLDKETIQIVGAIEEIITAKEPYSTIHKLPNLIEEFRNRFVKLLEEECRPVRQVIESDLAKVKSELDLYEFRDELGSVFGEQFADLLQRLDSANNFYEAIAMKEESDRLKLRCFEGIEKKKTERKPKVTAGDGSVQREGKGEYQTRRTVTVSMANILHGAKTIESREDIERLIADIRARLESELKEGTVIKLV